MDKRMTLAAGLLAIGVSVSLGGGVLGVRAAHAEEARIKSPEEPIPEYILGSDEAKDISIPKRENTTAYITVPSGVSYRAGDKFTPSEEGMYTVTYKTPSAEATQTHFLVCKKKYSVGSARSAVSYGTRSYGEHVVNNNGETLLTSISSMDKFSCSELIDLAELGGEAFLEFFVLPETIGTSDVRKIDITLTDAYDPENFVTISVKKGTAQQEGADWAEKNAYITANAASQVPTGLEHGKNNDIEIDGVGYQIHKSDDWGANITFSLPGNPQYKSPAEPHNDPQYVGTQKLALRFDAEKNHIYANEWLVTALSNKDLYGGSAWKGFTDGKCFLSISGSGYNAAALNLGITKLGKNSLSDIDFDNTFKDVTAPVIKIDAEGKFAEADYPKAVVGKAYALFKAEAVDDYSHNVPVTAAVYFDNGVNQISVDCTNGKFVPFSAGKYTVEYTASDAYGNVGNESIEITAEDGSAENIGVAVNGFPESAKAGEECVLPAPEITGNRGNAFWRAVATCDGAGKAYEISSDDPSFFPEYAGEYEVTYYVSDYVSEVTKTQTLTVTANDEPVLFGKPALPKYMLYGCVYNFPEIEAKIYSDGTPVNVVPEIYVSEDGGAEKKVSYRYVSYAARSVRIIYRVDNGGHVAEYSSEEIPVIDCGYGGIYRIEKYFVNDGLTAAPQGKFIRFTADPQAEPPGAVKTTFINALQTFDFNVSLSAAGSGFRIIDIYLTDASDDNVQIKLTYRRHVDGGVYFSLNGGEETLLESVYFDDADNPLSPNVTANGTVVMPTGATTMQIAVNKDLLGNDFAGFKNSMAYLSVELGGIETPARTGLDIFRISGQSISGIYLDNIKPRISAAADSGARRYGTKYTIDPVYVADVLDPSVTCTMSVKAPDGSYAIACDGTVLNERNCRISETYELTLDQYGRYEVIYEAVDIGGNRLNYSYILTCADMTPPEVEILAPITEGSVNTSIEIARIAIEDNHDADGDFTIYVSVETPQGQVFGLVNGTGGTYSHFVAQTAGVYTVHYLVVDTGGNATHASYKVTVR